jgi:hypothetical protein
MLDEIEKSILVKLLKNSNISERIGVLFTSTTNPSFEFNLIRDYALIMRVIIDIYIRTNNHDFLIKIINYIENEYVIQNMKTLTYLQKPKRDVLNYSRRINRRQYDCLALRGINIIKIYNLLSDEYKFLAEGILEMIKKDLIFILDSIDYPCFDIWDKHYGWHFYTRIVELKFLKDCLDFDSIFGLNLRERYEKLLFNFKNHLQKDRIISSFDKNGNVIKLNDSSIFLGLSHIDYDDEIMKLIDLKIFLNNSNNLLNNFKKKDKYFDKQICALGLIQYYYKLSKICNNKNLENTCIDILFQILSFENIYEKSGQINNLELSSKKVSLNYSELFVTFSRLNNN